MSYNTDYVHTKIFGNKCPYIDLLNYVLRNMGEDIYAQKLI